MQKESITQAELKELLNYDPETGTFRWKVSPRANVKRGAIAGTINSSGHRQIKIHRRFYSAHRLAWLYILGVGPTHEIDHIDGNKDNNAFSNLREANDSQQKQNVRKYKNNKTGFLGVSFNKKSQMHIAQIQVDGKKIWLGAFATPEEAYAAYCKAKKKYHSFQPEPRE